MNTSRNPDQIDELSLKERGEVLAPLVKLILLTHNPGDWLEEVLLGIAAQDYLSLDITVIDTTRRESIEKQVKSILPESSILHLKNSPGFSALTPKNLDTERNCLFYFFVTDDLVLDATAVRRVVESALEMNAGVTGLKVVGGENTELLQDVGSSIDRYGTTVARHQLNEIDQGQYDGKREVFAASSSAFLVRKDLFETVGGFDPLLGLVDGHTDLCWRARLVGANIVLSPNAVGRSTITSESQGRRRRRRVDPTRFGPRHRIRMIWTNRKISRAIMLSFELLIITVLGTIYGLVRGRFRHVLSLLSAWTWNLRHLRSIRSRRLFIFNKERSLDHDISIDAPSHAFRRAATGRDPNQRTTESNLLIKIQNFWMALFGPGGLALIFGIAVLGFGSRHLLTRGLPAIGRFQPIPENPLDLFYSWWEGWRPTAGGMLDSGVDALALLGGLGWLLPMNSETVMAIAVLSAFPLGAFGIWQLVQPIGGGRSRAAAVAIYLAVPTPYHALGEGRFGPLVVYASLPWIIHRLSIAQGVVPYGEKGGTPGPGAVIRSFWADTTALGLLLSLVIFFEPLIVIPTVITFIALLVGSALAGSFAGLLRLVLITIGATAASAIVHFTILIDLINGRSWESWVPNDNWTQGLISPGSIFRFDTGPFGISSLAWAFLIIPAVSLITTNGWRLAIAIRSWFLIAGGFAAVYFVDQGWFTRQAPAAELLIIPAAVGVALASAAGVASLGQEIATKLKRRKYVTAVLFAGALVLVIIPVVSASLEGRWGLPEKDFSDTVPYLLGEEDANGVPIESTAGRVLWVGAPNLLPAAGIGLEGGIALALTDGYPNIGDQSPYEPSQSEAIEELHAALLRALNGDISRLGERVGVWSVSHIVLMENSAPIPYGDNESLLPEKYFLALTRQLDLERVEGLNRSLEIFSNTAVEPIHAVVRDSTGRSVPSEVKKTGYASIEVQSIVDGSYRWRLSPVDEWEFSSITGASNEVQLGPQGEPTVRMASGSIGQLSLTETDNSSDRMLQMIILLAVLLLTSWSHSERKKYQS